MASNVVVVEADPWDPSDVTEEMLQSLVDGGLLCPVTDLSRPEWIAPYGELEPRPRNGYVGMRDVRSSPPPVPEDTGQRVINHAHADTQKKRKDAKAAKRTKHILVAPGASASSPAPLGRRAEADLGPAVAPSGAEADMPEARSLGKCTISPVSSAVTAEPVAVEATPPAPQRTEGASGSAEDRPAPMDVDAAPLPPPPPSRMRFAVAKLGLPRSNQKRPAGDLPLAPLKVLKASPGSSAHWVAEAQAAIQRGAASARVDPKEPAAQGRVAKVAPTRSDGAIVPFVAEAPGASGAEAMEAPVPMTAEAAVSAVGASASTEATMTEVGAPETAEAVIAEAGAPEVTTAVVMVARPSAQEAEMQAAEASAVPLAQGLPLLREKLGSEASRAAEASRVEAQWLKEQAEACQAETRRWELKAKGELRGLPSLT
ncbi:uncharacterized protein [Miscanthus floridulus]|uniref:uncharacterized protein n=1 Tax=Miscanthus floridulus TaxID=154761 RepID=UPI003457EBFA